MNTVSYPNSNSLAPFYNQWDSIWSSADGTRRGSGYHDFHLYTDFPQLRSIYLESEKEWESGRVWTLTTRTYWWASIVIAAAYIALIFGGQRTMKNRKPMDLKGPLAIWNLFLALFSLIGTVRLVSHLLYGFYANHHTYFFCRAADTAYGEGGAGLWANLFVWSKYVELIDTVFLVLRKKPVSFLHWFHHATVMLYCWHASQYQMPTGIFFASMNYIVHSIMYFYYFLAAITTPPIWGKMVTVLQIAQMFGGMFVTGYHYYLLLTVPNCDGSFSNLGAAFVMYTAYMLLFVQFFVQRYTKAKIETSAWREPTRKPKDE